MPSYTDEFGPITSTENPFRTQIPSNPAGQQGGMEIYTDGSKLEGSAGGGVFSGNPPIELSFGLPGHCSVFKEKNSVAGCKENRTRFKYKDIFIFSEIQAAYAKYQKFC